MAGSALDLGETEVEDLSLAARVDEDVRRLDVTVNDSLRVRRLERIRELNADIEQARDVERGAENPLRERLPFQQFHGDEVLPLELIDRVDGADRRMVERRRGARFPLKALQEHRVLRHLGGGKLERDAASERRVLGFLDDTHPPPPPPRLPALGGKGSPDEPAG